MNAEKLIRFLRSYGKDLVSWSPNGNVKIRGQNLRGVNIVDLVGDVVRAKPSKSMPPQREQFLNVLAQANIPEALIKNRLALEHYRAIKNDRSTSYQEDENIISTNLHKEEISPKMRKKTDRGSRLY